VVEGIVKLATESEETRIQKQKSQQHQQKV
jgi:hypothetical protein